MQINYENENNDDGDQRSVYNRYNNNKFIIKININIYIYKIIIIITHKLPSQNSNKTNKP